eukprot:873882-Prymnesium_polylepis.1
MQPLPLVTPSVEQTHTAPTVLVESPAVSRGASSSSRPAEDDEGEEEEAVLAGNGAGMAEGDDLDILLHTLARLR